MSNHPLLDALTREGVLVNVSVRFWRAAKKLNAEDLGLQDNQVNGRLISLGHKRLLPKEALSTFALIEGRAHAAVEKHSFPFLGGIARFVPNTNLSRLNDTLHRLQEEFQSETACFLATYDQLRRQSLEEWRDAAYRLEVPVEEFVDRIAGTFPPSHKIQSKFTFDIHTYQIAVPDSLHLNAVQAGDQLAVIRVREEVAREAASKLTQDAEIFVADCVATLRQETANICHEMLTSMQSGKTEGVHQKTLNRLLKFIEDFKTLNFAGDDELERMLEHTRKSLLSRTAVEYRDNVSARTQLQSGLKRLGDEARKLAQQESREIVERFGQVGVRKFALSA
jgi:hypothetical protein